MQLLVKVRNICYISCLLPSPEIKEASKHGFCCERDILSVKPGFLERDRQRDGFVNDSYEATISYNVSETAWVRWLTITHSALCVYLFHTKYRFEIFYTNIRSYKLGYCFAYWMLCLACWIFQSIVFIITLW